MGLDAARCWVRAVGYFITMAVVNLNAVLIVHVATS
jgi:hypothetical protein